MANLTRQRTSAEREPILNSARNRRPSLKRSQRRVGLWMIGACGSVGSTVALGISALRRKQCQDIGMTSALPVFRGIDLVDPKDIVVGGHEVRKDSLMASVQRLHEKAGVFSPAVLASCRRDLAAMQRNIRSGSLYAASSAIRTLIGDAPAQRCGADAVETIASDLAEFRRRHRLDHIVVIHLASTEPPASKADRLQSWSDLEKDLRRPGSRAIANSSLYAAAAILQDCSYINFTPSPGVDVPALRDEAQRRRIAFMGNDGKTGETLVKSALAPMFASRNLKILSWFGQNILGNRDGAILRDPQTASAKKKSKDRTIRAIVGGDPETHVGIQFVASLDDWKVAWDFIHFEGFLGTKMSMQFTWQGCDSLLAAPLVIDLVRFTEYAARCGESGPLRHLSYYFKDPIGVESLDLSQQWRRLLEHVAPGSA